MLPLQPGSDRAHLRVLCLGAHSDDIEIGCAATLLRWMREYESVEVAWAVFSAGGARGDEARASARELLQPATAVDIALGDFQDAHLPADFARAKAFIAGLRQRIDPDVVLTHRLDDRHQDHRLVAELTWQTWRNHLVLEYEIPKYEGDLGQPNLYVPVSAEIAGLKTRHLSRHFGSQRSKDWFSDETFLALMRLRGLECRAPSGLAEAFVARKMVW